MSDAHRELFEAALRAHPPVLSERGRARRDTMRRWLETAVVTRRRRRLAVRGAAAAAAVVIVAGAAIAWRAGRTEPVPHGRERFAAAVIRTEPGIAARCTHHPPLPPDIRLDDHELVALLRRIDRPAGLIRAGDTVRLTADVVDVFGE